MIHCPERHYFHNFCKKHLLNVTCNRKLKSKSGFTLHLEKCSQNVHVSQQNKAKTISQMQSALPLPTSLSTIVSPTSVTPADTMTTFLAALTTVWTVSRTSYAPTITAEVDIPPHHTDEASNISSESFPPLSHISTKTFLINIPKNHYKWGDYNSHTFEKNLNVIYDIIVY